MAIDVFKKAKSPNGLASGPIRKYNLRQWTPTATSKMLSIKQFTFTGILSYVFVMAKNVNRCAKHNGFKIRLPS